MIGMALALALFIVNCIITSVVVHECGHAWAYYRITKRKVKITWGVLKIELHANWRRLTPEQYRAVLWCGVVVGIIYLFLIFSIVPSYLQGLIFPILALYLYGSRSDLKNIIESYKQEKKITTSTTSGVNK